MCGAVAGVIVLAALVADTGSVPAGTPSEGGTGPIGDAVAATVLLIVDGDTIGVEIDGRTERVRYVGVDAPELARDGTPAECGGGEATEANERLVAGAELILERDVSDRDRFGRLLRHPWVASGDAWVLISEELVASGAIEARSYPPDTGRDDQLDAAERTARAADAGIWGGW